MSNSGGGNGNFVSTPALEQAAYDQLPGAVRAFLGELAIQVSAVAVLDRFKRVHGGSVEAWICEAEELFPRFRDGVTAEVWGKDHPSIGGPILESDYARPERRLPRRRA